MRYAGWKLQAIRYEAGACSSADNDLRRSDDDFGVYKLLVKRAVLALLVTGRHKRVALVLEPFSNAKLVFRRSQ